MSLTISLIRFDSSMMRSRSSFLGVRVFPVDVADELRISGDHGERGAEFMGDIRDDFFPEDIDSRECLAEKSDRFREFAELIMTFYIGAGGKVVRGELIDRVLDREDRLCEIPGADGREDGAGDR